MKRILFTFIAALALVSCNLYDDGEPGNDSGAGNGNGGNPEGVVLATEDSGVYINGDLVNSLAYAYYQGSDPYPDLSSYSVDYFEKPLSQDQLHGTYYLDNYFTKFTQVVKAGISTYSFWIKKIPDVEEFLINFDSDMKLIDNPLVESATLEIGSKGGMLGRKVVVTATLSDGRVVMFKYDGSVVSSGRI